MVPKTLEERSRTSDAISYQNMNFAEFTANALVGRYFGKEIFVGDQVLFLTAGGTMKKSIITKLIVIGGTIEYGSKNKYHLKTGLKFKVKPISLLRGKI